MYVPSSGVVILSWTGKPKSTLLKAATSIWYVRPNSRTSTVTIFALKFVLFIQFTKTLNICLFMCLSNLEN